MRNFYKILFLSFLVCCLTTGLHAATFQSKGTGGGAWNSSASWTILFGTDSDGFPDLDDNATILAGDIITSNTTIGINNLTINGTFQGFTGNLLYIYGNYVNNGVESGAGGIVFASSSTGTISGSGTFAATMGYTFQANRTILAGTTVFKTGNTSIASGVTIRNNGIYTISFTNSKPTSRWINEANSTLNLRSPSFMIVDGTLDASATGNTVNVTYGTGSLPRASKYYDLNINGTGSKSIPVVFRVGGDLTIASTTSLNFLSVSAYFEGNITNNGTVSGTDSVSLIGATTQTIGGSAALTLRRLFVNGAGAVISKDLTIAAQLSFTAGKITTGSNKIIVGATTLITASQSTGWVNGNLQSTVPVGNYSRTFAVGNASSYLPATLDFNAVTTQGNVTAAVLNGDHPNIATSCIDQTKSVNHYWRISNSSTVFSNFSATFDFQASNMDASADPNEFFVARFVSPNWTTLTPGTLTSTSTQATGITAFGDFAVGELKTPTFQTQPTDITLSCAGSTVNFSATVVGGLSTTYQWIEDQGSGFANVVNGGVYSGATTNTLTLTGVTTSMGGYHYALLVNHGCGVTLSSDTVDLFVYANGGWHGTVNTDWNTGGNWCGGVPTATTDATVYAVTNQPILSAAGVTRNLLINLGATIDLNGQTLSIGGPLSGDGFIKGSSTSSLSFSGNGVFSTLLMDQTSSATRRLNNLTINIPTGGVTMGNAIEIGGVLTITAGNYHSSSNSITLLSSASGTSRIAQVGATGSMSGSNFNIQRFLSSRDSGYVEMSSTVQNAQLSDWDQELNMYGIGGNEGNPSSSTYTVYSYSETLWDYVSESSSSRALNPGEGFFVFLFDAPANTFTQTTAVTTGTPNYGGVNRAITKSNDGWNFVGNPYHSFISWASVKAANPTLAASYQTYNDAMNDFQTIAAGEIPPGHGFWVQTSSATTLSLPESIKTTSTGSQFIRQSDYAALKITMTDNFSKSTHVARVMTNGSSDADANDVSFIQQNRKHFPAMYLSSSDNRKLVINSIGTSENEETIPVQVKATQNGVYIFEFSGLENISEYTYAYFKDNATNEIYDLNKISKVSASVDKGQGENRFELVLSRKATPSVNQVATQNVVLTRTDNGANLIMTKETETPSIVTVYNALGQEVLKPATFVGAQVNVSLDLPVKGQYYFVQIQGDNGVTTKKLFY